MSCGDLERPSYDAVARSVGLRIGRFVSRILSSDLPAISAVDCRYDIARQMYQVTIVARGGVELVFDVDLEANFSDTALLDRVILPRLCPYGY